MIEGWRAAKAWKPRESAAQYAMAHSR